MRADFLSGAVATAAAEAAGLAAGDDGTAAPASVAAAVASCWA